MNIECRLMRAADYGVVECAHWHSAEEVGQFIKRQGIASMLAFEADRYLGQLYLTEYDLDFREPGGWYGNRPWADFRSAQPLNLRGRFLTLGCYHVGWLAKERDHSLQGRGIGTALLKATVDWFLDQQDFDGLLTWACQPGSKKLLAEAGQMPHTVYCRFRFREIKQVQDAFWNKTVTAEEYPDATEKEPGLLRVMLLERGVGST